MEHSPLTRCQQAVLTWLAVAVFVGLAIIVVVYILTASANVVFSDTWSLVPLLGHMLAGRVSPGEFWAGVRHNENREVLLTALLYLSARFAHLNLQAVKMLSVLFSSLSLALLALAYLRQERSARWTVLVLLIPVAGLLFSLNQWENWLEAFNTVHFLAITFAVGATVFLEFEWPLALVLVLGVLSTFSSAEGLVVWPVLAVQAAMRREFRRVSYVLSVGMITVAVYLHGLGAKGSPLFLAHHLRYSLHFLLVVLGNTVFGFFDNQPNLVLDGVAGAILLGFCCWTVVESLWSAREESGSRVAFSVTLFGLGVAALITEGRAPLGLAMAAASRYSTITVGAAVGPYLFFVFGKSRAPTRWLLTGGLLTLITVGGVSGAWTEMHLGRDRLAYFQSLRKVLLTGDYSDRTLAAFLWPPNVVRQGIPVLKEYHLNVFWVGEGPARGTSLPLVCPGSGITASMTVESRLIGCHRSDFLLPSGSMPVISFRRASGVPAPRGTS